MRRFGKTPGLFDDVEELLPSHDAGGPVLTAADRKGVLRDVDLTLLRDGGSFGIGQPASSNRKIVTLRARPDLFAEMRPAILAKLTGAARASQQTYARQIGFLWAFLEAHDAAWPDPILSVADIDNRFGVIFRQWFLALDVPGQLPVYTLCRGLINTARGMKGLKPVAWPSIGEAPKTEAHRDVDPRAVRQVRQACVRRLYARTKLQRLELDLQGSAPGPLGDLPGVKKVETARSPELLARMRRHFMRRCVVEGNTSEPWVAAFSGDYAEARRALFQLAPEENGATDYDLLSAPDLVETGARLLLVMAETGWVDTARNVDLGKRWFVDDGDPSTKTGTVALFARRPKTGVPMTHVSMKTASSPWRLIQAQVERTAYLRGLLEERKERILEGQVPLSGRARIAELQDIEEKLRSPWLYFSTSSVRPGSGAVQMMSRDMVAYALDAVREEMFDPRRARTFTIEERAAIEALRPSDLRDGFAERVYRASGGNIFAVKAALGHRSTASTVRYLRQRKQINAAFRAFTTVTGVALSEVGAGYVIDPAVLRARCFTGKDVGISDELRRRLAGARTRMGMGCASPFTPPPELAPGHEEGSLCAVQRCVLCKHGFFFKDAPGAMDAMASRHGELRAIRDVTHVDRFHESSFRIELVAVETVMREFYGDRQEAFLAISDGILGEIRAGRRPSFAQIPLVEGAR